MPNRTTRRGSCTAELLPARSRARTAGGWWRGPNRAAGLKQTVVDGAPELRLPALVGRERQRFAARGAQHVAA
ncbi:hypothetical protein LP419_36445 [Massilia sp. H-1]|nr:hypothetical protein LP419_36445 [Massilia sp. H-1]